MKTFKEICMEIEDKLYLLREIFPYFTFSVKILEDNIDIKMLKNIFMECDIVYDMNEKLLYVSYENEYKFL